VYLIEVLDTQRRELLGSVLAISISIGISLMYLFGYFFSWIVVSWIFIGIVAIQCIGLCFVPESPLWLMSQNCVEEATKSLKFLRGKENDVAKEVEDLKLATNQTQDNSVKIWKEFLKPEAYKPLSLLIVLWIFQQFSGNYAVVFYAVDIFEGIGHDAKMEEMMSMKENSYLSAIAVGSIRIIGSILGAIFLKKQISRRVLMTCSAIGMFLSMSSLAAIEQIMEQFLSHSTSSTLLVVSSSSFILSHAIGFNVIPMLMVGELCPVNLKSLTSGITIAVVAVLVFTVVKVFPIAMVSMGATMTYGFFAVMCVLASVFSFYFVPETRGKTVDELQNMWK